MGMGWPIGDGVAHWGAVAHGGGVAHWVRASLAGHRDHPQGQRCAADGILSTHTQIKQIAASDVDTVSKVVEAVATVID